jgi:hypothetical protein
MHRAAFGDVELDYEITGAGEPILLVHHGAGRNWFDPLLEEPVLVGHYSVVRYHRAGYGGSRRLTGPLTFDRDPRRAEMVPGTNLRFPKNGARHHFSEAARRFRRGSAGSSAHPRA